MMTKRIWIGSISVLLLIGAITAYSIRRWGEGESPARSSLLAAMPADASTVVYADFAELRRPPSATEFYKWAPQPPVDPEYAQFLRDTGFDYERDLERVGIAIIKRAQDSTFFAVADGKFDNQKMNAYAMRAGSRQNRGGRDIFSVPVSGSTRNVSFTFLRKDRIALTDDSTLKSFLAQPASGEEAREWNARFERLAGSPVFAVIRQDAAAGNL